MTPPTLEWYREQSDHNRVFYELVHATWPDKYHDWKVTPLFYSGLHRINYWLVRETGRAPESHFERKRLVGRKLPQVFKDYRDLYELSMRARYLEGYRLGDDRRGSAYERLCGIEERLPF